MTQSWIVTFNYDCFNIWDINNLSLHTPIGEKNNYRYYKRKGQREREYDRCFDMSGGDGYYGNPINEYSILVHEFDEYLGNNH